MFKMFVQSRNNCVAPISDFLFLKFCCRFFYHKMLFYNTFYFFETRYSFKKNYLYPLTKRFDGRLCHTLAMCKNMENTTNFHLRLHLPIYNKQIRILINTFCNRSQKQQFNICLLHYIDIVYKVQSIASTHV